jgi:hypothetical protein
MKCTLPHCSIATYFSIRFDREREQPNKDDYIHKRVAGEEVIKVRHKVRPVWSKEESIDLNIDMSQFKIMAFLLLLLRMMMKILSCDNGISGWSTPTWTSPISEIQSYLASPQMARTKENEESADLFRFGRTYINISI